VRKGFSIDGRVVYSTNIFLKIKTVFLHDVIAEMPSFSMRPAKYFYDNPLLKGSDQRKNRGVWSNVNTRYLVWRCGDGRSFAL
jgi:hypothetical protein